ncbi:MAG TPA: hypothetical protein VGH67_02845 [Solirubrobacteraceae bacterium]|jgi:hypothetical protein
MRVAWVHPTWRDLVIERLAGDAELRRHFLACCGPHGIVLALSTEGGAAGERALPLVVDDEDWDALGDRIYGLVPELDHAELVAVLRALRAVLETMTTDWTAAGEARVLARMTLERTASLWESAAKPVLLDCVDAWLTLSDRLGQPQVWPGFLAATWADLLPAQLPEAHDLAEMQRFADWVTLCELLGEFSPELLGELGYGAGQDELVRSFREGVLGGSEILTGSAAGPTPSHDIPASEIADTTIRRVLADL